MRVFRLGISPVFLLTLSVLRSDVGVHANLSFHIYKFGVHLALSTIN